MQDNPRNTNPHPLGRPRDTGDKTEQNTVKSLDRALIMLSMLAKVDSITLTALAKKLKESPATVYRNLVTFQSHGIVRNDPEAQTWEIGSGAFLIGSTFLRNTGLVEISRVTLRELMEETGETANLGIQSKGSVLFISQVETHAPIRAFFPPGTLSPLHASGIGKALLAHASEATLKGYFKAGMEKYTEFTNATEQALRDNLELIRATGFSLDDQERNIGMRCIAAPVFNAYDEAIAGISISGPAHRIGDKEISTFSKIVIDAANRISAQLGARLPLQE